MMLPNNKNISFEVALVILFHYQFNQYDLTMNIKIVQSKEDTVLMPNVTNNRMIQASFNLGAIITSSSSEPTTSFCITTTLGWE
jgi:hypothetical protein